MVKLVFAVFALIVVSGCQGTKIHDLKSPCVAAESNTAQHPCGSRRSVNDHWLG